VDPGNRVVLRLHQRLASGDTVRVSARDRSDARVRQLCGSIEHVDAPAGDDFCLQARRPDQAGIATVFASDGRRPAISAAMLIPPGARTVTLEARTGDKIVRGQVTWDRSTKASYTLGLVAVAGTAKATLPARLTVQDGQGNVVMRSDWIPSSLCHAAGFEVRACSIQVGLDRLK
jgi:hypothetical protein